MKKTLSKKETLKQIEEFFSDIKNKNPKEVKKIKRLAMAYNVPLKEKRKLFCKKCLMPYSGNEKMRIKRGKRIIKCENCGYIAGWKIKN